MTIVSKPQVIALEEHYQDPDIAAQTAPRGSTNLSRQRLADLGELRLQSMDESGIDIQVLGHIPWTRTMNPETAIELAARANDRVAAAVIAHPSRLAGFATLPLPEPIAAADELERSVTQHGFRGAMVFPLTNGVFLDDKRFWPLFERAEALDVPLYMHPGVPHDAIIETYYRDYMDRFPLFSEAAWGFGVETATVAIRMILSGLFETFPRLQIILGHMGEYLPFALDRLDETLNRRKPDRFPFREYFCDHFYITTSGDFSTPALLCSMMAVGVDRILFSVDWPYVENEPGIRWMETVPLSGEDKAKILGGNAKRLLKL